MQAARLSGPILRTSLSYRITFCTHRQDGSQWGETTLTGNEKIEDTVQCVSTSGRPGHATIQVRPSESEGDPICCCVVDSESLPHHGSRSAEYVCTLGRCGFDLAPGILTGTVMFPLNTKCNGPLTLPVFV